MIKKAKKNVNPPLPQPEQQQDNYKLTMGSTPQSNQSGGIFIKSLERGGVPNERQPSHLPGNEGFFPAVKGKRRTLAELPNAVVYSESTAYYNNDTRSWETG